MTLKEMLATSVAGRPDHVAFRYKSGADWQTMTYAEFQRQVWRVAEQLAARGVSAEDRVAVFFENHILWPAVFFAIVGLRGVAVPIDPKLRQQEIAHILRDSCTSVLVTAAQQYPVVRDVQDNLPELRHVLIINGKRLLPIPADPVACLDFAEAVESTEPAALQDGRAYDQHQPAGEDVAALIYTSGTTGRAKGAMLTHGNLTANVHSCLQSIEILPDENFLLVLPIHHAFALTTNLLLPLACGTTISMVQSLRTVSENMREVSPSAFIGVPLLVEKMHARILSGLKKRRAAYALYRAGFRDLIARGIRRNLGGRLRMVVTGGAPCNPDVLRGFQRLGIQILEGYGLTEASPVLTLNPENAPRPGTVGKPLADVEIAIHDPNAAGIGEIKARGPNIMKGYFHNPEATADAFDGDWFMTGDLGCIDPDGYLIITGRKKSLIVNREGKNIYPEEVEAVVTRSPYILEALVLGYREPSDTVGERVGIIVVPNHEAIDEEAARTGKVRTDREVVELLRAEVKSLCGEIADYKRPRKIQVRMVEFEKTSTEKIKRYLYDLEGSEI